MANFKGFLESEALDWQELISHLVWGPQYIVLSQIRIRWPSKKRHHSGMLRGGLGADLRITLKVQPPYPPSPQNRNSPGLLLIFNVTSAFVRPRHVLIAPASGERHNALSQVQTSL